MIVDGVDLEIARFGSGSGTPIILLHEGLGSVGLWRDFPFALASITGREVIAWSRRGYGQSAPFDGPYGLGFMHFEADISEKVLKRLDISRAHLLGHSDGASIALLHAVRHPARIASLIVEAPHVFVEPMTIESIVAFGQSVTRSDVLSRMAKYHRDPAAVFAQWHDIWTSPRFPEWSIEAELEAVKKPVLVIQGEDDEYGSFAQLDKIAEQIPQTKQLRLSSCGHSPHRDRRADVLDAVRTFLNEVDP